MGWQTSIFVALCDKLDMAGIMVFRTKLARPCFLHGHMHMNDDEHKKVVCKITLLNSTVKALSISKVLLSEANGGANQWPRNRIIDQATSLTRSFGAIMLLLAQATKNEASNPGSMPNSSNVDAWWRNIRRCKTASAAARSVANTLDRNWLQDSTWLARPPEKLARQTRCKSPRPRCTDAECSRSLR